jgi:hypothetical protein
MSRDCKKMTLNIDGVLCCAANVNPNHVIPIAVYSGVTKPIDLNFLTETIQELSCPVREIYGWRWSC